MCKVKSACALFLLATGVTAAWAFGPKRPVTIKDCIEATRIQQTYDADDPTVVFSPDGRQFLSMIWRGDVEKNVNHFTLLVFDAERLDRPPRKVLTADYTYDKEDQHARPLKQFVFLPGNKIAALATLHGEPRQVVSIDVTSGSVTPWTNDKRGVLAFAAADNGAFVYAVAEPPDPARKAALYRDGFSLTDPKALDNYAFTQVATGEWFEPAIQYYLVSKVGAAPQKIFDAGDALFRRISASRDKPVFWMSPDGRHAIVHPWMNASTTTPTFGLIDMKTGAIERLAPGDDPSYGHVLWAPDAKSVVVYSGPLAGGPARIYEVTLADRRVSSVGVGEFRQWDILGWNKAGDGLLLARGGYPRAGKPSDSLATTQRTPSGWSELQVISKDESKYGLNARYNSGTNGRLVVGVRDGLSTPPELAAYDLSSKEMRILTHLNPQLEELAFGEVTRIHWSGPYDKDTSVGDLIKPVGYVPGKKYPLIIQFKDEGYYPNDESFLLDGGEQYSGAAIQVWANEGFMVLHTPSPLSLRAVIETPEEDEHITAHVESGLDLLESQGLIDRAKVALSGWSRAGWWSETVVTKAKTRFAAVSNIDNVEYNMNGYILRWPDNGDYLERHWGGRIPWGPTSEEWRKHTIDFMYDKAQTPRLIEIHGVAQLPYYGETYSALRAVKIPVDFYVYPDAPHNLKSPVHRLHSLAAHNDWFRFWLQEYEDPDPAKAAQYERWRKMRSDWHDAQAGVEAAPSGH